MAGTGSRVANGVWHIVVNEFVTKIISDAELKWACAHTANFEPVMLLSGHVNPLRAIPIFEFGDGVAMIADLYGRPIFMAC